MNTEDQNTQSKPATQALADPASSGIPICRGGEYIGDLPEGAKIDALIVVNGEAVMGAVKNINGKAVALIHKNDEDRQPASE